MAKDLPIMLDLETLGTRTTSVMLSIGAVKFDPDTNTIVDKFYVVIDREDSKRYGLTTDAATEIWWSKQSAAARTVLKEEGVSLAEALGRFSRWCDDDNEVWGNGSDFDNAILGHAYSRAGLVAPWKFFNSRCYRTAKRLLPEVEFERTGTYHNAVDDAESQALHLMNMMAAANQHSQ